jgi:pyrroline-5-carboxylate reductase
MRDLTIGVLGFGKLGVRIVSRLIKTGINPHNIYVVERPSNRLEVLRLGVRSVQVQDLRTVDILIIAVKPYQMQKAVEPLASLDETLVISFMANVSIQKLKEHIKTDRIVRAMTTTSCEAGKGVGLYATSEGLDDSARERAHTLLARLGRHDHVVDERHVEVFGTTLSSLTGMVYQILGDFDRGMNHIGAPRHYRSLMLEAVASAVGYAQEREDTHLLALSDEVTSPAGTTDAARMVLEEHRVTYALIRAIEAAARKAQGLAT